MAQEKAWLKGIDYIYDENNQKIKFLNQNAILNSMDVNDISDYSAKLVDGNSEKISAYINSKYADKKYFLSSPLKKIKIDERNEGKINRQYITGTGMYAIPGSSIKGSLRSILLKTLNPVKTGKDKLLIDNYFGNISNNVMRFFQVSDVIFNEAEIFGTKIYGGNTIFDGKKGEWKHKQKESPKYSNRFNDTEFISYYESLKPGSLGGLKISVGNNLNSNDLINGIVAKVHENYNKLIPKNQDEIIKLIQKHTAMFMKMELDFFNEFKNDATSAIISRFKNIGMHNLNNEAILRVGAGSGFHSITGDWQENQHHLGPINDKTNQLKNKTRKFAFDKDNNGNWILYPMGFIKLTPIDENDYSLMISESLNKIKENRNLKLPEIEVIGETKVSQPETAQNPNEPYKPTLFNKKIKHGVIVDAEVVQTGNPFAKVKIFVEGHEAMLFDVRYPNLPHGKILKVMVGNVSGKGIIQGVSFYKL